MESRPTSNSQYRAAALESRLPYSRGIRRIDQQYSVELDLGGQRWASGTDAGRHAAIRPASNSKPVTLSGPPSDRVKGGAGKLVLEQCN